MTADAALEEKEIEQPSAMDSVAQAFEDIEKREAEEKPAAETVEARALRERDEAGRFAKKAEPKEIKTPEASAPEAQPPSVASPESKAALPIPEGLAAPFKARWNELPSEWQQEISRREDAITKGLSRMDEERHYGRSMRDVITPYMPMIAAEGGNPQAAIQSLLNTAYVLRTAAPQVKEQLFANLAKQFGVNIQNVMQQPAQPTPQIDVRAEVQKGIATWQQQQEMEQAKATISAFAADPKNPHYETVKADMAALLQAGRASSLQDAYERACYAHPEVRATLLAASTADSEAKRTAEMKAKADAAKKAASSVVGAPSTRMNGKAKPASATLDPYDSVREAWAQHEGGRL